MGLGKALLSDNYKPYTSAYHGKVRPHVTGSLIGAAGGAVVGGMFPNMNPGTGAMMGATAGALAMPAMGLLGAGIAKFGPTALAGAGTVMAGATVGAGAIGAAGAYGAAKVGVPVAKAGMERMGKLAGSFVKHTPEGFNETLTSKMNRKFINKGADPKVKYNAKAKWRPSKLGIAGAAAILVGMGGSNIANDVYDGHAGTPTGGRKATPNYLDNAGATGDLVFAMHQNRRG